VRGSARWLGHVRVVHEALVTAHSAGTNLAFLRPSRPRSASAA
jgi:hypothetical protein